MNKTNTAPPVDRLQQTTAPPVATSTSTPRKPNVYSRLSDPKSYTGISKKRLKANGHDLTERVVHNLSNANLKYDASRPKWMGSTRSVTSTSSGTSSANALAPSPIPTLVERLASTLSVPAKLHGDPNDPHTLLKAIFHYYCRFWRTGSRGLGETTLDNLNFVKLCRDSPDLLGLSFSKTDVDLIFVRSKKKGERRINYTRFLDALGMIAIQKYGDMPLKASVPKLLEAHLAYLPCLLELTDGETVQAVWQKRADHNESIVTSEAVSSPKSPLFSIARPNNLSST
ncbi:hypothetical protein KXD40_004544 [Peronospora effusa]|uniref:Uncharacterized protein n=1 Tax=Peronospora effusa TaxID=542832 RepID=A0A3M6V702_9STRA|nr:hypothetical protein DD238_008044 [Peronospora effusa]RQM15015.1 hypothetical protein DD237_007510 [Peronospora effusa]UIZ28428.1 hypothetical protein KXD40_004544 [Peronospora effusa]CAI5722082.1 unnamed protein product [Peronospora effusa]